MAIKIRQNGIVKDLVINASEVAVLDVDGNFKSKNLETILKQIATTGTGGSGTGGSGYPSDAEFVYVKDTEPDMDGVWLDESDVTSDDSSVGSNSVVKEIKSYVNSETSKINASLTNAKAELEEKDAELLNKIGILNNGVNQISNPNLLINGDFQIWQRGTSFSGANIYTADRWMTNFNATVAKANKGLSVVSNERWGGIRQFMEITTLQRLAGQQITVSAKVSDVVGSWCLTHKIYGDNVPAIDQHAVEITEQGIYSFTMTIPNDVFLYNRTETMFFSGGEGMSCTIEWVKLEVSPFATPFIPRLHAEELALCKRYYESTLGDVPFGLYFTGKLEGNYNFSVEKRTAPTVTFKHYSDTSTGKMFVFSQNITGLRTTTVLETTTKAVRYEVDRTDDTLNRVGGSAVMFGNITADAEIY